MNTNTHSDLHPTGCSVPSRFLNEIKRRTKVGDIRGSEQRQLTQRRLCRPREVFNVKWESGFGTSGPTLLHELTVSKAIRASVKSSDIAKRVTADSFTDSFATHLIEPGYDICTIQELLGHSDVRTKMISTQVLNKGAHGVQNPADFDDFVSE